MPSRSEPAAFWSWVIKGLGGALCILEGYVREQCYPSKFQLELLEYQLARLMHCWQRATKAVTGRDVELPRTVTQIEATKCFNDSDVIKDEPTLADKIAANEAYGEVGVNRQGLQPPQASEIEELAAKQGIENPTPEDFDALYRQQILTSGTASDSEGGDTGQS